MSGSGLSEDERRATVRMLVESAPEGVDVHRLLGGSLAGAESADRPDVPVWEYAEHVATHPDLTLDDLASLRFPFRNAHGDTALTSLDELVAAGPVPGAVHPTRHDVVDLYGALHAAGLLRWDAETRTVVQVEAAPADVAAVVRAWRDRVTGATGR
ncbi:hypothetical protein [Cellulomonas sp. URHB0016]